MRTMFISQKEPAFHWHLQARARSPQRLLGTHTNSGGVKPAGWPDLGQKLVCWFSWKLSDSGPREDNARHFYLKGRRIVGIRPKGMRGRPLGGANWHEVPRKLFLPPMPEHRSASLWPRFHITFSITRRQQQKQGIYIPTMYDGLEREPPFPKMGIWGGKAPPAPLP